MYGAVSSALACAPVTPLAHVEERGDGPVQMVLIPGWLCDWSVWDPFMEMNEHAYTMRAVTLPGVAGAPAPPMPDAHDPRVTPWMNNAVQAIATLIEDEAGGRAVVVGHSMGGVIGLRLALERPDLVERVVSVDGFPAFPLRERVEGAKRLEYVSEAIEPSMRAMNAGDWHDRQERSASALVRDDRTRSELLDMFLANDQAAGVQYVVEYLKTDLRGTLGRLDTPVLFIAAVEEDAGGFQVEPEKLRAEWKDQVEEAEGAKLVFFENTRHFVVAERPAAVSRAIAEFIHDKPIGGVAAGTPVETKPVRDEPGRPEPDPHGPRKGTGR